MTLSHFLFNHPNKIKKDKILLDFVILHIFFVHQSQHLAGLLLFHKLFTFQIQTGSEDFLQELYFRVRESKEKDLQHQFLRLEKLSWESWTPECTRMWIRMDKSPKEYISFEIKTQNKHHFAPFRFDHHQKLDYPAVPQWEHCRFTAGLILICVYYL